MLPSPEQTWAHSTCCVADLARAMEDDAVTAIEADIVMGTCTDAADADSPGRPIPIMAHPPARTSDLSFRSFLEAAASPHGRGGDKILKLDIKEGECVRPVLDEMRRTAAGRGRSSSGNRDRDPNANPGPGPFVFFNADILPGPGRRRGPTDVSPDDLIGPCLEYMDSAEGRRLGRPCAFLLGWRTDPRSPLGYSEEDARSMERTIRDHDDLAEGGVVLAVNARVLSKSVGALDGLMAALPACQVLVWTATGEPPVSAGLLRKIRDHFAAVGCHDRVGFDCNVAPNPVIGLMLDALVGFVGIGWTVKQMCCNPHR